jgi:hypothetical protein
MKLPFLNKKNDQESAYYLALLLTDEKASAVILQEYLGKLKIIGKHEEKFSMDLEDLPLEEITSVVDKTISVAEEVLPPDIETHKTVFGVKEEWIDEETKKIKKEYLTKLKKVCDSLDLTPVGFMVITEAISHLLQQEEGAPLSAILAEVGKKTVALSLLRGGKIVERIDGPRGESAPETVDKLLRHFTTAVLPARIIILDGKHAEQLSQQFIHHQWSKGLPFIHVPQVTMLPQGFDARAITFGAATQMGFELQSMDPKKPLHDISPKKSAQPVAIPIPPDDEQEGEQLEEKNETETEDVPMQGDNFGFVQDQDIANAKGDTSDDEEKPHVTETSHHMKINDHHEDIDEPHHVIQNDEEKPKSHKKGGSKIPALPFSLPKFSMPSADFLKKKGIVLPIAIVVGILILFGGLIYYYLYQATANVILTVQPKMVDQSETVTFSTTGSTDFSEGVIAARELETTVDGQMSTEATGKKDTGDKAKGSVTIYNNGDDTVTLNSGTQVKANNGTIFLLDKDVKISSASGDIFSGTKPGKEDVSVTAKDLGTDSNVPSGTKFAIGGDTTLAAKNDSAFSGGTKKQLNVVSQSDLTKLKTDLPKSLENKADDAIKQSAEKDETVLPVVLSSALTKAKYDKKVDDEAKKVSLAATVAFTGIAYKNSEVKDYAKSLLKDKYANDTNVEDNTMNIDVQDATLKKNKTVSAKLILSAGLLPNIDTDDVVKELDGKSYDEAKAILNGLPQVTSSEINFSPGIPLLPSLFPRLPQHITVEVKSE